MQRNRTDSHPAGGALLKAAKEKLVILGAEIQKDSQKRVINTSALYEWIRLKNLTNMARVCDAFYRGSLFYDGDEYHFASEQNLSRPYKALTTVSCLKPCLLFDADINETIISSYCYIIDDHKKPSDVLDEILFSTTSLECSGSIFLAFHLTLLNLCELLFGKVEGRARFDFLFQEENNEHYFDRLRFGTWSGVLSSEIMFSPIHFFIKQNAKEVTFADLSNDPERYIGFRFYIEGHPSYLEKHPKGSARGWNVFFLGLNESKQLLFLGAFEKGCSYIFTYDEFLEILTNEYNELPQNAQYANFFATKAEMLGLSTSCIGFDFTVIENFLFNFRKVKEQIKFCANDFYYQSCLNENYIPIMQDDDEDYIASNIIKKTKDDSDLTANSFFKPGFRQSLISKNKQTQDDTVLYLKKRL